MYDKNKQYSKIQLIQDLNKCNYNPSMKDFIINIITQIMDYPKRIIKPIYLPQNLNQDKIIMIYYRMSIPFMGSNYNVPLKIYITKNFPYEPPKICVDYVQGFVFNPNNREININNGEVMTSTLYNWNVYTNIDDVMNEIYMSFCRVFPIYRPEANNQNLNNSVNANNNNFNANNNYNNRVNPYNVSNNRIDNPFIQNQNQAEIQNNNNPYSNYQNFNNNKLNNPNNKVNNNINNNVNSNINNNANNNINSTGNNNINNINYGAANKNMNSKTTNKKNDTLINNNISNKTENKINEKIPKEEPKIKEIEKLSSNEKINNIENISTNEKIMNNEKIIRNEKIIDTKEKAVSSDKIKPKNEEKILFTDNNIKNIEDKNDKGIDEISKYKNRIKELEQRLSEVEKLNESIIKQLDIEKKLRDEKDNIISKNQKTIKNLEEKIKKLNSNDSVSVNKEENIYQIENDEKPFGINFISTDQKIHYPMSVKNSDLISRLEEELYNEYPEYKEYNTYLTVNGSIVKRFKTLEENKIKKGDAILVNIIY